MKLIIGLEDVLGFKVIYMDGMRQVRREMLCSDYLGLYIGQ